MALNKSLDIECCETKKCCPTMTVEWQQSQILQTLVGSSHQAAYGRSGAAKFDALCFNIRQNNTDCLMFKITKYTVYFRSVGEGER